jgi:hypothetical protein
MGFREIFLYGHRMQSFPALATVLATQLRVTPTYCVVLGPIPPTEHLWSARWPTHCPDDRAL